MLCAIHGKQTNTKKMKADLDEMIVREAWWGTSGSWELLGSLYWKSHQKTRSASSHTNRNGRVLFYHSKCKTKPVLLSMVPPFADHYVLPSRKIPIRILSTMWGQTTPSVLCYKSRWFFFKMAPKKSGKASGFHLIGIHFQSSWLSGDMVGN